MIIHECIHTESKCYKTSPKAKPVGIVVHSTGANNPSLKRYVQPSKNDKNRDELIKLIGKNPNGNHWNRSVNKAVHFFIGKLASGAVGVVRTLPETISAWGVGSGKKGSYNYAPYSHIQFEVCEDNLKNENYFKDCYNAAVSLCADICRRYGWEADVILSHKEAHKKGYGSNHGDIDHWLKKYKLTMNDFRNAVDGLLHPVIEYKVKKGDSLSKIAKKHNTTVKRIVELNGKKYSSLKTNPNYIKVGWVLTIER